MIISYGPCKDKDTSEVSEGVLLQYLSDVQTVKHPGLYEAIVAELANIVFRPAQQGPKTTKDYELIKGLRKLVIKAYHPDVYKDNGEKMLAYLELLERLESLI